MKRNFRLMFSLVLVLLVLFSFTATANADIVINNNNTNTVIINGDGDVSTHVSDEDEHQKAHNNHEHSVDVKNFEVISQLPNYPSGCEITSAAMALHYIDYNVSNYYLDKHFLAKDNHFYYYRGKLYGPDPRKVFAGDPKASRYGCFSPVLTKTINDYLKSERATYTAKDISGSKPDVLYNYVEHNTPVIVWATMGMEAPTRGNSWYLKGSGKFFRWTGKEHCVVLIGSSNSTVTIADPLAGKKVKYSKNLFEKRYSELDKQAIVIVKK